MFRLFPDSLLALLAESSAIDVIQPTLLVRNILRASALPGNAMQLALLLTSVQLTVVERRVDTRSLDRRRANGFRVLVDAENPLSSTQFVESYTANILAESKRQ